MEKVITPTSHIFFSSIERILMNDNVSAFEPRSSKQKLKKFLNSKGQRVKKFLRKPIVESTQGDTLILHASIVAISVTITISMHGLAAYLERKSTSQNLQVL